MVTRRSVRKSYRRGSALVLTALMLIPLLAIAAFAIDWGRLCLTQAELQRAADAAAMAGTLELLQAKSPASGLNSLAAESEARNAATEYSALNTALGNKLNLPSADISIGQLRSPLVAGSAFETGKPDQYNAVRVTVRRDAGSNGAISMFFARLTGTKTADVKASATAAIIADVAGFRKPLGEENPNIPLLPFAIDTATWQSAAGGDGNDDWKWDADAKVFIPGRDHIPEFNLYPERTGSSGNRGTVNIGTNSNSTSHVAKQILNGISPADLDFHGGELKLNSNGELYLSADPGISAGFEKDLLAIRGQTRVIPIFSKLTGNGSGAVYTIVGWGGIRLVDVDLSSKNKVVIVQPARVTTTGAIPGTGSSSKFVFSRVWLAQ